MTDRAEAVASSLPVGTSPVSARISDRLVDILILASEVLLELQQQHRDASSLTDILPIVEGIIATTDKALKRLSS